MKPVSRPRLLLPLRSAEAESRAAMTLASDDVARHQREIAFAVQAAVAELARHAPGNHAPVNATRSDPVRAGEAQPGFDREYLSAYFAVQAETMAVLLQQADHLVVDGKLSREQVLLPLLQAIACAGEALLAAASRRAR